MWVFLICDSLWISHVTNRITLLWCPETIACLSKGSWWEMGSIWNGERIGKDVYVFWKREILSSFMVSLLLSYKERLNYRTSILTLFSFSFFSGEVRCDAPNNKLGRFTGVLSYKGKNHLLDLDKLLLRGCVIRNTDWCYGLVIYTGTSPWATVRPQPPGCRCSTRAFIRTLWLWAR